MLLFFIRCCLSASSLMFIYCIFKGVHEKKRIHDFLQSDDNLKATQSLCVIIVWKGFSEINQLKILECRWVGLFTLVNLMKAPVLQITFS